MKRPHRKLTAEEQAVAFAKTVSEIINTAIQLYEAGKPINVTQLKQRISAKHGLERMPKLVEIIAAIPEQYKVRLAWI